MQATKFPPVAVVCPCGRDRQNRVAYTHLTFRQLDIESDCLAQGLDGAGVGRGVRTILMVKPSLDFFALVFALFKVGAVPVVVDPGMGVSRMLNCLKESRAQALIGIPPAHVLRTLAPRYFRSIDTFITVGSRWFWGGLPLRQVRTRHWEPYRMADTRADEIAAGAVVGAGLHAATAGHAGGVLVVDLPLLGRDARRAHL